MPKKRKKLPALKGTTNKNLNQISIQLFGVPINQRKKREPETVEKKRKKKRNEEENYIYI
tara:strand:+ start:5161 stop:5340 length:180 start_codon:yes stop_codon:yes gene_type:complete